MSRQCETAMRCAAIICRLRRDAIGRLLHALTVPGGDREFERLLERFYDLDAELRTAIIERMATRRPRIIRPTIK